MVLLNTLYDDEQPYPTDLFPGGIDTTYPASPSAPPPAPVTPTSGGTVPGPVGPTGGGGGGGGGRPSFNFGDAPDFIPPMFQRPTFEQAQQEPGYQFRLQGGSDALERSAAARGVLRTGGTLRDLTEYGQNFAAQEYGNVYNRALQAFDRDYRGEYDAFAPRLAEWQFLSNAELQAGLAAFNRPPRGGGGGNIPPPPIMPDPREQQPGGPI